MTNINFKLFFMLVAFILFCANSSFAQQNISTEKKALIQEFRELTGAQNFSTTAEFSSSKIGDSFTPLIEQDKELTDSQKQELTKSVAGIKERIVGQIRDYFADKSNMKQLSDEVAFQLYDKNFTEGELRELVAFYRTPTGQKAAKFLPTVNGEMRKAFAEAFKQKLHEFVEWTIEAEIELLKQKIREAKGKQNEN